jgi:hypothetical protein
VLGMKKTNRSKLNLQRESVRNLSSSDLTVIAGGDSGSLSCTGTDCPVLSRPSLVGVRCTVTC